MNGSLSGENCKMSSQEITTVMQECRQELSSSQDTVSDYLSQSNFSRLLRRSRIRDANLIIGLQRAKRPAMRCYDARAQQSRALNFHFILPPAFSRVWVHFDPFSFEGFFLSCYYRPWFSALPFFVPMMIFFCSTPFVIIEKNIQLALEIKLQRYLVASSQYVVVGAVISQSLWSCSSILLTWSAFRNTTLL